MKQFLLFAGDHFYPSGGWGDFKNSFDTVEEAQEGAADELAGNSDWWQIVDITTGKVVKNG